MSDKKPEGPDVRNKDININEVIGDIKEFLHQYSNPKEVLEEYLDKIEEQVDENRLLKIHEVHRESVKKMIESHPYFKNPNDYGIRLIKIMKYLNKKGINTSIPNMDLLVDSIVKSIDGVEEIEFGKYRKKV